MNRLKHLGSLAVIASFALPASVYRKLPELVPVHWNWRGEIDAYAQRPVGAFLMPAITLFVYLLLLLLPKISPREFALEAFRNTYERIFFALLAFMLFVSFLLTMVAAGMPVLSVRYFLAALGISLVGLGLALLSGRARLQSVPNDAAARKRRLAGKLLLGAGLLTLLGAGLGNSLLPAMVTVPTALIFLLAYSFALCWRQNSGPEQPAA